MIDKVIYPMSASEPEMNYLTWGNEHDSEFFCVKGFFDAEKLKRINTIKENLDDANNKIYLEAEVSYDMQGNLVEVHLLLQESISAKGIWTEPELVGEELKTDDGRICGHTLLEEWEYQELLEYSNTIFRENAPSIPLVRSSVDQLKIRYENAKTFAEEYKNNGNALEAALEYGKAVALESALRDLGYEYYEAAKGEKAFFDELQGNRTVGENEFEYSPTDSAKIVFGVADMDMDFEFDKEPMEKEIETMAKAFEKLQKASIGSDEEILAHHLDVMLMHHENELSLVNSYLEPMNKRGKCR